LVIKVKDKIMTGETPEIPEEWLKRVEEQKKRVSNVSDEERRIWGFNPGETLKEKRQRDEEKNPSRR
jgi:histidine ammonia-lyase